MGGLSDAVENSRRVRGIGDAAPYSNRKDCRIPKQYTPKK